MTDQPKWTPGPWRADGDTYNRVVWSDADNRVCFMAHSNGLDDIRDIATSNLIAAAPDLYAALDGLLGLLDAGSLYEPQAYAARTALAKARGETK